MLWLSLHCYRLALDLLTRGQDHNTSQPLAITHTQGQRAVIHVCNQPARAAGVVNGMSLTAALALCNTLRTYTRDVHAEHTALTHIANWALQFTSTVSLKPPDGLLLEVEGSLRLFGDLNALQHNIMNGLHELGYHAQLAVAPTPLGSWLLCCAAGGTVITQLPALTSALRKLPIGVLELDAKMLTTLHGLGLRCIGDCLRLPRAGLNKRMGTVLIDYLDRAFGRKADPQPAYVPPSRFKSQLNLPSEVHSSDALLFAIRRLIVELVAYLNARGQGIQNLLIRLFHTNKRTTKIELALLQTSRDKEHLCNLLREHLDRLQLAAAVETIELRADRLIPLAQQNHDLFTTAESTQQDWHQLLEHLRARLGADSLQYLYPIAEHRPEYAWRNTPVTYEMQDCTCTRPLWLLEQPMALTSIDGTPWLESELRLINGPERIESGWWDDREVRRDYYVAENARQQRFWIFRELHQPFGWFLHGVFG
jgi:protein ImuB